MDKDALRYYIAISLIKNLGYASAKELITIIGSPEGIFEEKSLPLTKLKLKKGIAEQIRKKEVLDLADREIEYSEKQKINIVSISSAEYPYRLKQCADAPLVIYIKGQVNFNEKKVISVVGTRNSTAYGEGLCKELIKELNTLNILIVSGLAYGIDTCAHENALCNNLKTVAVLAHGLNRLYPYRNKKLAESIIDHGALISDFATSSSLMPGNFPARNRIIAGLSDATIVVESGLKGGSLITADIANSYNREVFAFPGKVGNNNSRGCHKIIKQNKAALIEGAYDLISGMNWDMENRITVQTTLFNEFNSEEIRIIDAMKEREGIRIDEIAAKSKLSINKTTSLLLQLEFKNAIKALPGKMFVLNT